MNPSKSVLRRSTFLRTLPAAVGAAAIACACAPGVASASGGHLDPVGDRRPAPDGAKAVLEDVGGHRIGAMGIRARGRHGVVVSVRAGGLTPGFHGVHLHAVGRCDANTLDGDGNPAPFSSAGGHLGSESHGHGHHGADLPGLLAMHDGSVRMRLRTDGFTLKDLLDADGASVVVHALPDNGANIPPRYHSDTPGSPPAGPDAATLATGDSGPRIACGVIRAAAPRRSLRR